MNHQLSKIQDWIETDGDAKANYIAAAVLDGRGSLGSLSFESAEQHFPNLTPDEQFVIRSALAWKAGAILAAKYTGLAEGWCEAYYRELKAIYEEKS